MVSYKKALLIGYLNENKLHDQYVRYKFHSNVKTNWRCDIALVRGTDSNGWDVVTTPETVVEAIQYACENDYKMILRPYNNSWGWKPDFERAYHEHGILTVSAHGSNDDEWLEYPPRSVEGLVFVGTDKSRRKTSDGPAIDFYVNEDSESYATGVVGGKLADLYEKCEDWNKCVNQLKKTV